jgi:hypothetical protein
MNQPVVLDSSAYFETEKLGNKKQEKTKGSEIVFLVIQTQIKLRIRAIFSLETIDSSVRTNFNS